MRRFAFLPAGAWAIAALLAMSCRAAADDGTAHQKDIEAVKKFLAAKYPGMTWGRGPARMQDAAIDAAYLDVRFYYVFSPQYPVARAGQVSAMMRLEKDGKVTQVSAPQDYSAGLMKIGNADDAKTAAAAVMSLTFGPFGPVPVEAKEVDARADGKGWTCTAAQGAGGPRGRGTTFRVVFDANGRCTEATHKYSGPLPICIGGLFRPVAAPSGIAGLAHEIGGALEVDSVDKDSIAERAGLKPGDLIVSFGGRPLPSRDVIQQMRQVVYALKQQGNVSRAIRVVRDGELVDLTLRW